MLVYTSDKNYHVYLEKDGDDLWVSVRNELGEREDFIVGSVSDKDLTTSEYLYSARFSFYPANYVEEHLNNNFDRHAVLHIATTAFEIDRALEEAYNRTKANEYLLQTY